MSSFFSSPLFSFSNYHYHHHLLLYHNGLVRIRQRPGSTIRPGQRTFLPTSFFGPHRPVDRVVTRTDSDYAYFVPPLFRSMIFSSKTPTPRTRLPSLTSSSLVCSLAFRYRIQSANRYSICRHSFPQRCCLVRGRQGMSLSIARHCGVSFCIWMDYRPPSLLYFLIAHRLGLRGMFSNCDLVSLMIPVGYSLQLLTSILLHSRTTCLLTDSPPPTPRPRSSCEWRCMHRSRAILFLTFDV